MAVEVRNQEAIAGAITRANFAMQDNRSTSTKASYLAKRKLWSIWCRLRGFADGETVTSGKLLLWLDEEVLKKGNQTTGKKKGQMLSPQGVEGYIKPIVDLYEVPLNSSSRYR